MRAYSPDYVIFMRSTGCAILKNHIKWFLVWSVSHIWSQDIIILIFYRHSGTKGKTDMIKLDKWGNDFERGDVDEYSVEAMDVGEILMVHLHNDQGGWWYKNPDWFVNKIAVISSSQDEPFEFPCYRWVLSDLVVFEGRGMFLYL